MMLTYPSAALVIFPLPTSQQKALFNEIWVCCLHSFAFCALLSSVCRKSNAVVAQCFLARNLQPSFPPEKSLSFSQLTFFSFFSFFWGGGVLSICGKREHAHFHNREWYVYVGWTTILSSLRERSSQDLGSRENTFYQRLSEDPSTVFDSTQGAFFASKFASPPTLLHCSGSWYLFKAHGNQNNFFAQFIDCASGIPPHRTSVIRRRKLLGKRTKVVNERDTHPAEANPTLPLLGEAMTLTSARTKSFYFLLPFLFGAHFALYWEVHRGAPSETIRCAERGASRSAGSSHSLRGLARCSARLAAYQPRQEGRAYPAGLFSSSLGECTAPPRLLACTEQFSQGSTKTFHLAATGALGATHTQCAPKEAQYIYFCWQYKANEINTCSMTTGWPAALKPFYWFFHNKAFKGLVIH